MHYPVPVTNCPTKITSTIGGYWTLLIMHYDRRHTLHNSLFYILFISQYLHGMTFIIPKLFFRSCGVLKDSERLGCTKNKSEKNERSSQMCACDTDLCNQYTPDPKKQDNVYGPVRNDSNKLYSTSASLIAITLFYVFFRFD